MRIVEPSADILRADPEEDFFVMALAGRTCYKSDGGDARKFVQARMAQGHESVIEHSIVTVRFVCDRGVSHELVRHRMASFSQESTRYCNYSRDKFDNEITVVKPLGLAGIAYDIWENSCMMAERSYMQLLDEGVKPEMARSVLPNSLKTEVVMTANLREWRHILALRTDKAAHPQMRELMDGLLVELSDLYPGVFDDVRE